MAACINYFENRQLCCINCCTLHSATASYSPCYYMPLLLVLSDTSMFSMIVIVVYHQKEEGVGPLPIAHAYVCLISTELYTANSHN